MINRPRRLRKNNALRALVSEHRLDVCDLVLPLFVREDGDSPIRIASMPGHYQHTLKTLHKEIDEIQEIGIPAVILFGIPRHKDEAGSSALEADSIIAKAIRQIKKQTPELLVISDLCFCEYTSHGHCGIITQKGDNQFDVDNDSTLTLLAQQALVHAQAGSDMIAPSGMMDGMVKAIRNRLDQSGFHELPILSYAVKYASSFYAPFREAANGAPQMGDRRSYQMDPANSAEALREASLDVNEGADMLMVKPAQLYLDIVYRVKQRFPEIPLAAYQVSGEFAMIKAAAQNNWLDEKSAMLESLLSIKRAGADFIITYFAKQAAKALDDKN